MQPHAGAKGRCPWPMSPSWRNRRLGDRDPADPLFAIRFFPLVRQANLIELFVSAVALDRTLYPLLIKSGPGAGERVRQVRARKTVLSSASTGHLRQVLSSFGASLVRYLLSKERVTDVHEAAQQP